MSKRNPHLYCSYVPALIPVVQNTTGPIVELGTGMYSTAILHWLCECIQRPLVSYETSPEWYNAAAKMITPTHEVHLVPSYPDAPIERPWSVAFVDGAPEETRSVLIERLATHAAIIVAHDSETRCYNEVYSLFSFRLECAMVRPRTVILSNTVDINKVSWFNWHQP